MSRAPLPRTALDTDFWKTLSIGVAGLGGFSAFGSWAIYGNLKLESSVPMMFVGLGIGSGLLFFVLSYSNIRILSVTRWALIMGLAAVLPFFMSFGFMGFAYFLLLPHPPETRLLQWTAILFATGLWCWIDLKGLRERVIKKRYIEREFTEHDDHVALRWERKTDLEAPPISDKTFLGRLWKQHGYKLALMLAPLSGAGYAMSRLLDRAGGIEAVLLVLAMLGLPLCIWGFSKLVCGFYLNVYLVRQIERRTGKPVLFDHVPDA